MSNELAIENNINLQNDNNLGNVTYEKQKSFFRE